MHPDLSVSCAMAIQDVSLNAVMLFDNSDNSLIAAKQIVDISDNGS